MALKLLTLLPILYVIAISIVAADTNNGDKATWSADSAVESGTTLPENQENYIALPESPESEETTSSSSDGGSEFMLPRRHKTCDWFPQICHRRSSAGPNCCRRKCTNVRKDPLNCGRCGRKCRRNEICCGGHCVNPSFDPRNCGSCGHHCKKWQTCVYGMCSYA